MSDEQSKMQYVKHRSSKKQEFCMRAGAKRRAMLKDYTQAHREREGLQALKRYMGEQK